MREWAEREVSDAALVNGLVSAGHPRLFARLLALRGVGPGDAEGYLDLSGGSFAKPCDLPGVREAAEAILSAVARSARIVVFGDYDCDGICATAILLKAIGAVSGGGSPQPRPFIPDRISEGYGMNEKSVARMLSENPGVGLVVTVDNGINSVEEVAALKARGVSVVVTDHHLPGDELPGTDVVVNPKVAAAPGADGLCGAGVAFLLAHAIADLAKERGMYSGGKMAGPLMVLAGLATVTDMMPLVGPNRFLVWKALKVFRSCAPFGLRELHSRASRTAVQELTARDFGFLIGPRINAAGRMASGMEALDLILADDREAARRIAHSIDAHNGERKTIEHAMMGDALSKIVPGAAAQVIDLPEGHIGVAGIVAARVMERLSSGAAAGGAVPVCVVVDGHGSARAPEGYNVRDAFAHASEALVRFGGHAAAGGFTVKDGCTERFRALFCEACALQAAALGGGRSRAWLDAWVEPDELSLDFADMTKRMEPFGEGNPEPLLGIRGVTLAEARQIGADGRHLTLSFRDKSVPRAVWWNHGDMVDGLRARAAAKFDIVFTIDVSDYPERHVELRMVDAVEAGA